MGKKLFFVLIIFAMINISVNLNAKPIYNLNTYIQDDPLIFENNLIDEDLADISGERIINPIDKENQGLRPKVYLIMEGEASDNMILDNDMPACPYIYMIVWPDGTTDFQIYNPYTGEIAFPFPFDINYPH